MKVLILAAGYATRLYPLTLNKAKPLLTIGGKPILEYIFDNIKNVDDLREVYIVTNSKFAKDFSSWASKYKFHKPVKVIDDGTTSDSDRLGAIGDMLFIINQAKIDDDLMVIAGDNLFNFELEPFVEFARKKNKACVGVHDLANKSLLSRYGVLSLDENGKVIEFQEKPAVPKSSLISMGLYYFPKGKLSLIGEYIKSGQKPDQPGNYISWLSKKEDVYGFVFKVDWYDIGDPVSLKEATQKFEKGA